MQLVVVALLAASTLAASPSPTSAQPQPQNLQLPPALGQLQLIAQQLSAANQNAGPSGGADRQAQLIAQLQSQYARAMQDPQARAQLARLTSAAAALPGGLAASPLQSLVGGGHSLARPALAPQLMRSPQPVPSGGLAPMTAQSPLDLLRAFLPGASGASAPFSNPFGAPAGAGAPQFGQQQQPLRNLQALYQQMVSGVRPPQLFQTQQPQTRPTPASRVPQQSPPTSSRPLPSPSPRPEIETNELGTGNVNGDGAAVNTEQNNEAQQEPQTDGKAPSDSDDNQEPNSNTNSNNSQPNVQFDDDANDDNSNNSPQPQNSSNDNSNSNAVDTDVDERPQNDTDTNNEQQDNNNNTGDQQNDDATNKANDTDDNSNGNENDSGQTDDAGSGAADANGNDGGGSANGNGNEAAAFDENDAEFKQLQNLANGLGGVDGSALGAQTGSNGSTFADLFPNNVLGSEQRQRTSQAPPSSPATNSSTNELGVKLTNSPGVEYSAE